mgnify:CR=1 FL=1
MLILVLMTGQFRNMLFLIVVLANLLIGIVQELHAKRMVDRLSIITATDCRVIRADGETSIPISQIVQDDLVGTRSLPTERWSQAWRRSTRACSRASQTP